MGEGPRHTGYPLQGGALVLLSVALRSPHASWPACLPPQAHRGDQTFVVHKPEPLGRGLLGEALLLHACMRAQEC